MISSGNVSLFILPHCTAISWCHCRNSIITSSDASTLISCLSPCSVVWIEKSNSVMANLAWAKGDDTIALPDPRFCNLQLNVIRVLHASVAQPTFSGSTSRTLTVLICARSSWALPWRWTISMFLAKLQLIAQFNDITTIEKKGTSVHRILGHDDDSDSPVTTWLCSTLVSSCLHGCILVLQHYRCSQRTHTQSRSTTLPHITSNPASTTHKTSGNYSYASEIHNRDSADFRLAQETSDRCHPNNFGTDFFKILKVSGIERGFRQCFKFRSQRKRSIFDMDAPSVSVLFMYLLYVIEI